MTLKIEIFGTPDHGPLASQIDEAMAAIGFTRQIASGITVADAERYGAQIVGAVKASMQTATEGGGTAVITGDVEVQSGGTTPKRERGKPAPGRARRTKEEIARLRGVQI